MIPLKDHNPTRTVPVLTYALITLNVGAFIWETGLTESQLSEAFSRYAVIPELASSHPFALTTFTAILTAMFLHGSLAHLGGNMLYLWLFGDNLEDRLGRARYLGLYLSSGFVAAWAQILMDTSSTIPMLGASGAIAGVLGAYLVMFPNVKVEGIVFFGRLGFLQKWSAGTVLGLWFVYQVFAGASGVSSGVAFFAHIGGFVWGYMMARST